MFTGCHTPLRFRGLCTVLCAFLFAHTYVARSMTAGTLGDRWNTTGLTLKKVTGDEALAPDTVIIPSELRLGREKRPALPLTERQFLLNTLNQGDVNQVFQAPPCLQGRYYIGFQLYYDLGDFTTIQDWSSSLEITLMFQSDTLWRKPLEVNMSDQLFISTVFQDSLVSCSPDYRFLISQKDTTGAAPLNNIYLKILLYKHLEDTFDPTILPDVSYNYLNDETTTSWNYGGAAAAAYDIEWVFIADYEGFSGTTAQEAFAFKEPVRITTAGQYYRHLMYYPQGRVWYRVRAIGYTPQHPEHRVPGYWSYGPGTPLTINNHETTKNWQRQTAFSEEGKYRKLMQYYDGTLRQRQALANLSTERLTTVGETRYDYEGRSVVEVMTVPAADVSLRYKSGFNRFQSIDPRVSSNTSATRQKFHYDNHREENSILSDQSGAGKYYSSANSLNGIHEDYIPLGNGYVYEQAEYLRDGTGRVTRRSGVGEQFRSDGDAVTRYYYGNAAPTELIRLFGSNVGAAEHYKKNLVVDPNGQVSISYMDQYGRVVATSLAGDNPPNVEALESYTSLPGGPVTVDISNKNQRAEGVNRLEHKVLNVTPNTNYTFNYDLSALGAQLTSIGCQACTYDLVISITDPDGRLVDLSGAPGNESSTGNEYERKNITAASCTNPTVNNISFNTLFREIGDYTVIKTLIPKDLSFEEMQSLVTLDLDVLQKIQLIFDSYVVDSAACEICTDCPEGETAINDAINEIAERDCDNIYQGILQFYQDKYGNASEVPYEVPMDSVIIHPDYCHYQLCTSNKESEIFEKQVARTRDWPGAVSKGYNNLFNLDPFFNNTLLSGYGYRSSMQAKLNDVYVATIAFDANGDGVQDGTNVFRGTIDQVADPANTAYYVDDNGNPNASNGRHILYLDLMGRRSQMSTSAYQKELNEQRWTLFQGFYLEAKRKTKLEIPEYQNCPGARQEPDYIDDMPRTEQGIADWGDANGTTGPVSQEELEMTVDNLAFNCNVSFAVADSLAIVGHLQSYFNSNPRNFFRLILRPDLDSNPDLLAIQGILGNYNCSLDSVALDDPINCNTDSTFNIIVNPNLDQSSQNCPLSDITAECYDGWGIASGTPNTSVGGGSGRIFLWAYPEDDFSEAVRGSFVTPLEPGVKYEICLQYEVFQDASTYTSGRVDQAYIQLSRSRAYINALGQESLSLNMPLARSFAMDSTRRDLRQRDDRSLLTGASACFLPGPKFPDPVLLEGQPTAVDKAWHGVNLTNSMVYRDTCIVFTPTEASTYFYISLMSCTNRTYQAMNVRNLSVRKILPRPNVVEFQGSTICLDYDTANSTLASFRYTVDWNREVALCLERANEENTFLVNYAIERLLEEEVSDLYTLYRTNCAQSIDETFRYTSEYKEYHYTLYYYDQSGNLVQTIPPQGVKPLAPAQVNGHLAGNPIEPGHTLATRYQYNSVNQLIEQQTPDAGKSLFWYNDFGELRLSQDAQQEKDQEYSYTRYDEQGRVIEVGEIHTTMPLAGLLDRLDSAEFPQSGNYTMRDVTRTHYDFPNLLVQSRFEQERLRNRVSWVEVVDSIGGGVNATFYSYDIHGNVRSLLQNIDGLGEKRVDYRYDLINGNVNYVLYQYDQPDQFIHRYSYDADNRIRQVYTSTDGYLWDKEAEYFYYLHGPLARVELGQYNVQGMDYNYTLQGWIKGVNMPYVEDPGQDGINGSRVGYDAYSYALGYYDADYQPLGNTINTVGDRDLLWTRYSENIGSQGLYNGNISWMVTDLPTIGQMNGDRAKGMQAMLYDYDQLNRIVKARSLTNYVAGNGFTARATGPEAYDTDYSYDANGNLLTLKRHDSQGNLQDDFQYSYYRGTNRLKGLVPILRDTMYTGAVYSDQKVYRRITLSGNAFAPAGTDVVIKATENIDIHPEFTRQPNASFRAYVLPEEEGTYLYDATGNLVWDQDEGTKIEWNVYGKVREVRKSDSTVISFRYDAAGDRVEKRVMRNDSIFTTHYVRDGDGNVLAIYRDSLLTEQPIYGNTRLGMYRTGRKNAQRKLGTKRFELANHLGNVLTVISDNINMVIDSTWSTVISSSDYYAFGLGMEGRNYNDSTYRYGFNGKEKDDEWHVKGGTYDYGFRIYNAKMAKFLSIDPLTKEYPMLTPYQYASNTPIQAIDLDGLEGVRHDVFFENRRGKIKVRTIIEVDIYVGLSVNGYSAHDLPTIEQNLNEEFNRFDPSTGESNLYKVRGKEIQFDFTIKTFNNDAISANDFADQLRQNTLIKTASPQLNQSGDPITDNNTGDKLMRYTVMGGVLAQDASLAGEGATLLNRSLVNPGAVDIRHTEAHELSHFLLMGSAKNPNTNAKHNAAGGIFKYRTIDANTGQPISGVNSVSRSNVKRFLQNIPEKVEEAPLDPDHFKYNDY